MQKTSEGGRPAPKTQKSPGLLQEASEIKEKTKKTHSPQFTKDQAQVHARDQGLAMNGNKRPQVTETSSGPGIGRNLVKRDLQTWTRTAWRCSSSFEVPSFIGNVSTCYVSASSEGLEAPNAKDCWRILDFEEILEGRRMEDSPTEKFQISHQDGTGRQLKWLTSARSRNPAKTFRNFKKTEDLLSLGQDNNGGSWVTRSY